MPLSDADSDLPKDTPPLTVMSLSIRSIVNHRENTREIVCASSRTWQNREYMRFRFRSEVRS
jgi:DNA polymerase alpha subunit A